MIINIDESRVVEAIQYAYQLDKISEHRCKRYSTGYDKMLSQFTRMVKHPNDEVLIYTENNEILGVLAVLVEPEEKYLEATGGVYAKENYQKIAMNFFEYLKCKYAGFQLDAVYPLENKEAISFMQSIGAKCNGIHIEMKILKNEFQPLKHNKQIVELNNRYYEAFCRIHDENQLNVYWTGKRILSAPDKFDILVALEKDELVGEVVMGDVVTSELGDKTQEVCYVEIDKRYRRQGYARSLLWESMNKTFLSGVNEITIEVEQQNTPALNLYKSFGFQRVDASTTYTLEAL